MIPGDPWGPAWFEIDDAIVRKVTEGAMSATPRPWSIYFDDDGTVVEINGADRKRVVTTDSGYYPPNKEDAELIVRAVNAFDALLAVARIADTVGPGADTPPEWFQLHEALTALDAAHPDWREWKP